MIYRMLEYLYIQDYTVDLGFDPFWSVNDSWAQSPLHVHAQMYSLGDKYDLPGLKKEAVRRFINDIAIPGDKKCETLTLLSVIPNVYTTTPESDRGLRDLVARHVFQRYKIASKHFTKRTRHRIRGSPIRSGHHHLGRRQTCHRHYRSYEDITSTLASLPPDTPNGSNIFLQHRCRLPYSPTDYRNHAEWDRELLHCGPRSLHHAFFGLHAAWFVVMFFDIDNRATHLARSSLIRQQYAMCEHLPRHGLLHRDIE